MRVAEAIELDAQTELGLRTLSKGRRVEARVQQRASVILLAARGWQNKDIAEEVKLDRRQVALWRRRFMEGGIQALLQDAARPGRTPSVTPEIESHILNTTLHESPVAVARWSTRSLAAHLGLSATTVRRVWQRNGIKPHLQSTFRVSRDPPRFEDKRVDVVGLYLGSREHALVFSLDEKSPIQGRQRTQTGSAGRATHNHQRNGTTTLLATLNTLDGGVNPMYQDRHRHEEWLRFLRMVDRKTPQHLQLHLIADNYATYRHPKVQAWLARHPRLIMHFTPASASWLNTVKRFFRDISQSRIRRDSFTSVAELQQAMAQHIEHHHKSHRPFIWTASARDVASAARVQAALARLGR